jgi:hypothetical protein
MWFSNIGPLKWLNVYMISFVNYPIQKVCANDELILDWFMLPTMWFL